MERFSIEPTGYEGPTGIVGVLDSRMREAGLETVSLWAGLPHYIAATPNSRGVLALVHKVTQVLDFRVDEGPLQRSAAEFEGRIAELVAAEMLPLISRCATLMRGSLAANSSRTRATFLSGDASLAMQSSQFV